MTIFEVHRLQPWQEARGCLSELQEKEGCLVARIGPVVVALPGELKEELQDLMDQNIGILRTDSDFRLRVVDG